MTICANVWKQIIKTNGKYIVRSIKRDEEVKRLNRLKGFGNEKYKDGLIKVLAKENKLSFHESKIIWNKAYESKYSNGLLAVRNEYDELVNMYKNLIALKQNR